MNTVLRKVNVHKDSPLIKPSLRVIIVYAIFLMPVWFDPVVFEKTNLGQVLLISNLQ